MGPKILQSSSLGPPKIVHLFSGKPQFLNYGALYSVFVSSHGMPTQSVIDPKLWAAVKDLHLSYHFISIKRYIVNNGVALVQ